MIDEFEVGASSILMLEQWKPVVGYEGLYEISNTGRIWSIGAALSLKARIYNRPYLRVKLCKDGIRKLFLVHSLVAKAFHGVASRGLQVNHCDGWKRNNRASNLEYVTAVENMQHAHRMGLMRQERKLKRDDAIRIHELVKTQSVISIANEYGVNRSNIYQLLRGEIWGGAK